MKNKEYYSAGELANLFHISRQTMFYYDKMGLLKPAFIGNHGYRYYAMQQYLTLEIILFLRKLDIAVPEIQLFLKNRSQDKMLRILKEKEIVCEKSIQESQDLLRAIRSYKENLECVQQLPLGQVLLQNYPASRMYMTPVPKTLTTDFDAISIRAKHVHEVFAHSYCKDKPTGWILPKEDFLNQKFRRISAVVTQSGLNDSPLPCNYIRPSGLYVSVLLKGPYLQQLTEAYNKLSNFIKINHLIPDGDVFLFPVVSYWATNNPAEYVDSISLKVTPPEKLK